MVSARHTYPACRTWRAGLKMDLPSIAISRSGSKKRPAFRSARDSGVVSYVSRTVAICTTEVHTISQTGTKEDLPCSGRGLCDTKTGICHCHKGFITSAYALSWLVKRNTLPQVPGTTRQEIVVIVVMQRTPSQRVRVSLNAVDTACVASHLSLSAPALKVGLRETAQSVRTATI